MIKFTRGTPDFSAVGGLLCREGSEEEPWRIVSYCGVPTVTVKNLVTGEERHFGIGGLMAQGWIRLLPEPEPK